MNPGNNPFNHFFAKIAASTASVVVVALAGLGLLVICCCVCVPMYSALTDGGGIK